MVRSSRPSSLRVLTSVCVHESGHASVQHLEERITDRVGSTAAQSCVLQNMRNSSTVLGRSSEPDTKDVVGVIARNVKVLCASLVVLQSNSVQLQFLNMSRLKLIMGISLLVSSLAPIS